jgi:hypothetical protein
MKIENVLGYGMVFAVGLGIGYLLMPKQAAAASAPAPAAPSTTPRAISSPGAGYAEQYFPNVNKFGLGAPFYTVPQGSAAQYSNGSVIFVD